MSKEYDLEYLVDTYDKKNRLVAELYSDFIDLLRLKDVDTGYLGESEDCLFKIKDNTNSDVFRIYDGNLWIRENLQSWELLDRRYDLEIMIANLHGKRAHIDVLVVVELENISNDYGEDFEVDWDFVCIKNRQEYAKILEELEDKLHLYSKIEGNE